MSKATRCQVEPIARSNLSYTLCAGPLLGLTDSTHFSVSFFWRGGGNFVPPSFQGCESDLCQIGRGATPLIVTPNTPFNFLSLGSSIELFCVSLDTQQITSVTRVSR